MRDLRFESGFLPRRVRKPSVPLDVVAALTSSATFSTEPFLLSKIRPTDLCDRLHYQHPQPGSHVSHGSHCGPTVPGVPIECRSPRKRGPYSMPIHRLAI
jgi:hypothetical protein